MGVRRALARGLASQLGNPTGWYGRLIAARLNRVNHGPITGAVTALDPAATDTVADLGFGGGLGLGLLLDRGATVHGVDYSPTVVARAARRYRSDRLRLHTASITDLPFPDAALDGFVTTNTLYFVADLERACAEFARVLRPTGRAVIGLGDPVAMAELSFTAEGFTIRPVETVVRALDAAGLTLRDHTRVGESERAFHLLLVAPGSGGSEDRGPTPTA